MDTWGNQGYGKHQGNETHKVIQDDETGDTKLENKTQETEDNQSKTGSIKNKWTPNTEKEIRQQQHRWAGKLRLGDFRWNTKLKMTWQKQAKLKTGSGTRAHNAGLCVSIQVWFYCIGSVFGVIVHCHAANQMHSMMDHNMTVLFCIHSSISFDKILNTTGLNTAPNHGRASTVFRRWLYTHTVEPLSWPPDDRYWQQFEPKLANLLYFLRIWF